MSGKSLQSWTLAAVASLVLSVAVHAQSPAEDLARLEQRFAGARDRAVHLLAPRAYSRAADRLRDAARRASRGEDATAIRRRLDEACDGIEAAEASAERANSVFREALASRDLARAEDATTRAPAAWQAAEQELERGGRAAERERWDEASGPALRAGELYARATVAAKRDRLLGAAENAREAALAAGASELAPETFARGEAALADGLTSVSAAADEPARGSGEEARQAFRRAAWLAVLADSVRTRALSLERFVNDHEADLDRLATAAGIAGPDLQDADDPTVDALDRAIRDLLAANATLKAELDDERAASRGLASQVSSLETALTDSDRRFADARSALLAREAQDDRLRETQALFTPEEGEVFLSGDDLVLRLHGLTFDSGSDDIEASMEPLLTKVQRVLLDFMTAAIRIEGHTDSQGSPSSNRTLSQRRAIAIRDYLLSRLPISSSRVEVMGFGEDRPIARNDTEEGRARNRRIEIILTLPPR